MRANGQRSNQTMSSFSEKFIRRPALTASEGYLRDLCDHTFLTLWSHVNVFRGVGQELCDLLVVCGDDIVIFSDKHCEFPDGGNIGLDWNRWFKRAIYQSAKQGWGAERWIRQFPNRVFLDSQCRDKFPFPIPPTDRARYHIIVVAHGCAERCAELYGGRTSLPLDSWVMGNLHNIPYGAPPRFVVGDIDPEKTFVHVLTDGSLERVLGARDTITDFVSYLRKKELLFRSAYRILSAGEDDLLPVYLRSMSEQREHDFVFPKDGMGICVPAGHWELFQSHPMRVAQLEANEVSYVWDGLIERFAQHAMEGTQYYATSPGVQDVEILLRFMAKEDRTSRRVLSKAFLEIVEKGRECERATRYLVDGSDHAKYVFMTLKKSPETSEDQYRYLRRNMLDVCCSVTKLKCPTAMDIIGIATEPGVHRHERSEDAAYMDARAWTRDDFIDAQRLADELNVGKVVNRIKVNENEYPTENI